MAGLPLTAVITCATFSVLAAGDPGSVPKTSVPTLVDVTLYPRWESAVAVA